jgi:SEC-C motif domain protein
MKMCPCYSKRMYSECCQPLHEGVRAAANALELMRSRYSAYAMGLVRYIIQTTHRSNPLFKKKSAEVENDIRLFCLETRFEGLDIIEFIDGETIAFVTFYARLHQGIKEVSFKEKSRFVKENNLWFYKGLISQ